MLALLELRRRFMIHAPLIDDEKSLSNALFSPDRRLFYLVFLRGKTQRRAAQERTSSPAIVFAPAPANAGKKATSQERMIEDGHKRKTTGTISREISIG